MMPFVLVVENSLKERSIENNILVDELNLKRVRMQVPRMLRLNLWLKIH